MDSTGSNIQTILALVRQILDETSTNAKFTNAFLVQKYLPLAIHAVQGRLLNDTDSPVFMSYPITVTNGQTHYVLPPSIQEVHGLVQYDSDNIVMSESVPTSRNHHDIRNRNWSLEGNELRIEPHSITPGTWYVLYLPSPDTCPHYATDGTLVDASTITLSPSPSLGLVDRRAGAYVGSTIRIIPSGSGPIEERIINSHTWTGSAWQVTLRRPLTANTTPGTVTYEIVPGLDAALIGAISYNLAIEVATSRQFSGAAQAQLLRQYTQHLKAASDRISNMQARTGKTFYVQDWLSK